MRRRDSPRGEGGRDDILGEGGPGYITPRYGLFIPLRLYSCFGRVFTIIPLLPTAPPPGDVPSLLGFLRFSTGVQDLSFVFTHSCCRFFFSSFVCVVFITHVFVVKGAARKMQQAE